MQIIMSIPESTDPTIRMSLLAGLVTRLGLMLYGLWQDSTMAVKYTDVDYFVFTDAAEFMTKGDSPYRRATYRYTPILAWILQPNILWSSLYAKLLFIACDILAGYLIFIILRSRKVPKSTAILCAEVWLLNPLPVTVSSRGNAESIMAVLVLGTLYYALSESQNMKMLTISAVLYGISIHTKIYPVTYVLPLYLYIVNGESKGPRRLRELFGCDVLPNWRSIWFLAVTGAVAVGLTALCYSWYGMEFLQETYLYHITRRDTRHNFSPYFYMLYLTGESPSSLALGLAAFSPQVALLVLLSFRFYQDLPFCCFLQTFVFVTFNKVCTSQYFLWYLSLLPLVIPQLYMELKEAVCLISLWFLGQAVWLLPAYYLEFEGQNTFILLWIGGFIFFLINIWILHRIVQCYQLGHTKHRRLPTFLQLLVGYSSKE